MSNHKNPSEGVKRGRKGKSRCCWSVATPAVSLAPTMAPNDVDTENKRRTMPPDVIYDLQVAVFCFFFLERDRYTRARCSFRFGTTYFKWMALLATTKKRYFTVLLYSVSWGIYTTSKNVFQSGFWGSFVALKLVRIFMGACIKYNSLEWETWEWRHVTYQNS